MRLLFQSLTYVGFWAHLGDVIQQLNTGSFDSGEEGWKQQQPQYTRLVYQTVLRRRFGDMMGNTSHVGLHTNPQTVLYFNQPIKKVRKKEKKETNHHERLKILPKQSIN